MKCLFCKSSKVLKQGYRKNSTGKKQKFQCVECRRWFVKHDGFERMRHKKKDIARAIHLHSKKYSLSETVDHLLQHDGVKVTRKTVSDWTKKYSIFLK